MGWYMKEVFYWESYCNNLGVDDGAWIKSYRSGATENQEIAKMIALVWSIKRREEFHCVEVA